jgi:hypothetical protein
LLKGTALFFKQEADSVIAKLDPEAKRLRKLTDGDLADEVGGFETRIAALKSEAIRRNLQRRFPAPEHGR